MSNLKNEEKAARGMNPRKPVDAKQNLLMNNAQTDNKCVSVAFLEQDLWRDTRIPRAELESMFFQTYELEKTQRPSESDAEFHDHVMMTFMNAISHRLKWGQVA